MKRILTYFMISLLLFASLVLADDRQVSQHDSMPQLGKGTVSCEFVLIRDASIGELTQQTRVREFAATIDNHKIMLPVLSSGTLIHKSNVSFMTRRNCVCIPLRL